MNSKNQYYPDTVVPPYRASVIGLMSGTSLDGVDIAYCHFTETEGQWKYKIIEAQTIKYNSKWTKKLKNAEDQDIINFIQTHTEYGYYLGELTNNFIEENNLNIDFISSHGHTVFHQPEKKITFQIGDGSAIATKCSLPVICDFRSLDVSLGGQGAPLVPIGDKLLFSEYDYCLNLGGFANISYDENGERIAYDICPVNIALNKMAKELGKDYDDKGKIAASGKIDNHLLEELNSISFYEKPSPKSLGKEWFAESFFPILSKYNISVQDKLRTVYEHIAFQIANTGKNDQNKKLLLTGGGTYNDFMVNSIKALSPHKVVIPDKKIINFKEAMIFAFLGVLRMRKEINCLKSVTGASKDSIAGAIYWGK